MYRGHNKHIPWPNSTCRSFDIFRSIDNKHAKKELDKNFSQSSCVTEESGLLGSSNHSLIKPTTSKVASKHLPPAVDVEPDLSLIKETSHTASNLTGAMVSHNQHYKTNFNEDMPLLSMEETRKNVGPALKENSVKHQKSQILSTDINNLQPLMQDKTKPPAKTVPSSNVNKFHRSLPPRACLVHLKEQYHLDHDLLSQPRATKYLVKVRTEISPGRYMAKLELHCSRYVTFFCDGS